MGHAGLLGRKLDRPHLLGDEGAGEGDSRPEENAAAEDHFPVEAVAQVTKDGGSHHEAADEHCGGEESLRGSAGSLWLRAPGPDHSSWRPSSPWASHRGSSPREGDLGQSRAKETQERPSGLG